MLADARPVALLAVASLAGVLAYARPDALLAVSWYADVLSTYADVLAAIRTQEL